MISEYMERLTLSFFTIDNTILPSLSIKLVPLKKIALLKVVALTETCSGQFIDVPIHHLKIYTRIIQKSILCKGLVHLKIASFTSEIHIRFDCECVEEISEGEYKAKSLFLKLKKVLEVSLKLYIYYVK
jgi:hypothetical protein